MPVEQGNEQQPVQEKRLSPLNVIFIGGLAVAGIGVQMDSAPLVVGGAIAFFGGGIASEIHERHLNR